MTPHNGDTSPAAQPTRVTPPTQAAKRAKKARLSAALRANLARRKAARRDIPAASR